MHLKSKILMLFCIVALLCATTTPAFAAGSTPDPTAADEVSTWDKFKDAGASLWGDIQDAAPGIIDSAKEHAGNAVDTIKENAPGWIDSAKDTASDLYQGAKDHAPEVIDSVKDGLQSAGEAVTEYRNTQEDVFWNWFDRQTGGVFTTPTNPDPTVQDPPVAATPAGDAAISVEGNPANSSSADTAGSDSTTVNGTDIATTSDDTNANPSQTSGAADHPNSDADQTESSDSPATSTDSPRETPPVKTKSTNILGYVLLGAAALILVLICVIFLFGFYVVCPRDGDDAEEDWE